MSRPVPGGRRPGATSRARVRVFADGVEGPARRDDLVTEEPLEVRLSAGGRTRTLAVTMRTPGHDFELAAGFLYGEGVVRTAADIRSIGYCTDPDLDVEQRYNVVTVQLAAAALPDLPALERHFATSSACGVCGRAGLDVLHDRGFAPLPVGPPLDPGVLYDLPDRLRPAQRLFAATGGLHAAGLFAGTGDLLAVREDVGRHNAVDKLVGQALLAGQLPLAGRILVVSGRAGYEIVQKAVVAGIPVVAAVSAPSSLAVALAEEFGLTLVGFLRGRRCNVYADPGRVRSEVSAPG
ncbi:MAG: formate dehydrogenase accessory sulfurtransferase FdhD [Actinomycetota bacterium]